VCGYGSCAEAAARQIRQRSVLRAPAGGIVSEAGLKKDYKDFNEGLTGPLIQFASARDVEIDSGKDGG
jgi:hypothetical protein